MQGKSQRNSTMHKKLPSANPQVPSRCGCWTVPSHCQDLDAAVAPTVVGEAAAVEGRCLA